MGNKRVINVYTLLAALLCSGFLCDLTSLYALNLQEKQGSTARSVTQKQVVPVVCLTDKIIKDTVWRGELHVPQRVSVKAGVTLTIEPGSVIRFAKDKGLRARGKIIAVGTKESPILFSIIGGYDGDSHWHQIMVENSDSVFENCIFEFGSIGLHSHFSKLSVRNSRFINNETGMMFKGGPVSISGSNFSGNVFGLVLNLAKGEIGSSNISGNEVGIMVRAEEKSGMKVHGNNIYNNSRYNLKMGDFNNGENIDVRQNWWSTANPADMIFDDRFEPGIGRAVFEPYLKEARD